MGYSLISRFRGALLGAAIGEMVGFHYHGRQQAGLPSSDAMMEYWGSRSALTGSPAQAWGRWATQVARELIQHPLGQFEPGDLLIEHDWGCSEAMAIALLPLLLYSHDRPSEMAVYLKQILSRSQVSSEGKAIPLGRLMILAHAVGYVLKPSPDLNYLIADIDQQLNLRETCPELEVNCAQVQDWLRHGKGIAIAQGIGQSYLPGKKLAFSQDDFSQGVMTSSQFHCTPIALYGFLCTPEDFRLSLLRTARLNYYPQITCTLVGALSGAYNGMVGIPSTSLRQLNTSLISIPSRTPLELFWNVDSTAALIEIADQLFKVWAGVYDPRIIPSTSISIAPFR